MMYVEKYLVPQFCKGRPYVGLNLDVNWLVNISIRPPALHKLTIPNVNATIVTTTTASMGT